ncbi:MAG: DUF4270 domain-containing protein [Chlorobi bacterium]|nr:DUF4270 domain-containing protein [Chlorobiota bacterium]
MTKSLVNKNSIINGLYRLIAVVLVIVAFASCAKSPNKIGSRIMPENSKLKGARTDTTSVYAYSEYIDSVRSDELSFNYLGSLADPVFGTTVAGFYSQLTITSLNQDFGPNPQLDSLILQLSYQGYYGDTNVDLRIHVYELEEMLELDQDYFSNLTLQHGATDYLNASFRPRPNDSTIVVDSAANNSDTTKVGPVEKFNLGLLDPGLGNKLLSADTSIMNSTINFKNFFKGLYVTADAVDNDGCLVRFNLVDLKSGLVLYYKNDTVDSLYYSYKTTITTPRVSKYVHFYENADPELQQQVFYGDTSLGKQKFYVQGLSGIRSVIKFPHLIEWARHKKVAINEAKLIFTGFEQEPYLGEPNALLLVKRNADKTQNVLIDQYEGETFFGGTYKSSTHSYTFRITNHIQKLLLDTTNLDHGLYVYTNADAINPKRFIFNGNQPTNDTISPFRLEIIYTDLN